MQSWRKQKGDESNKEEVRVHIVRNILISLNCKILNYFILVNRISLDFVVIALLLYLFFLEITDMG